MDGIRAAAWAVIGRSALSQLWSWSKCRPIGW